LINIESSFYKKNKFSLDNLNKLSFLEPQKKKFPLLSILTELKKKNQTQK